MRGIQKILGRTLSWAWNWIKRPKNFMACFLLAVGLPGLLDDIGAWLIWIDEWIALLPEGSVEKVDDFLASDGARWGTLGLALFIFEIEKIRLGILWFFDRAEYAVAVVSGERHFISRSDARHVVRRSDWATARRLQSEPGRTIYEQFQKIAKTDPAAAVKQRKFEIWCGMVLNKFESLIDDSTRVVEGNKEYDEAALREWLKGRYEDDVIQEFGEP